MIAKEKARQEKLEKEQKVAEKKAEMQHEITEVGDDKIVTKESQGPSIIPKDLLERLGRYQGIVGSKYSFVCRCGQELQ